MNRLTVVRVAVALASALAAASCASRGEADFDHCKVSVSGTEKWVMSDRGLDVGYRVSGEAGSPAKVWLAAKRPDESYISGYGVDVGPGPFEAVVDLDLTAKPQSFRAVLEVSGKRCWADAPMPKT